MVCYDFSDLFDISFDFEMKRRKQSCSYFSRREKKEKKFDTRPPGIEPGLCYRDALNIAGSNCFAYFKM